jgi:hypothetical protein
VPRRVPLRLGTPCMARRGVKPEPSAAVLDSRGLRSTPETGAGAGGAKRQKGSKLRAAATTIVHHPLRRFQHDQRAGGGGARGGGLHQLRGARLLSATAGLGNAWDAGTSTGPSGEYAKADPASRCNRPGRRGPTRQNLHARNRAGGRATPTVPAFYRTRRPDRPARPSKRNRT